MMGPDDIKVPELSGPTGLGEKNLSDLAENLKFVKSGDTIKATGTLKTITKWTDFDADGKNTGHFLPIKLPDKCNGQQITCKGRADGDRTVEIDPDLLLITRLENLSGTTFTLEMDGTTLAKIDVSALIPVGAAAYNAGKTDFGRYGDKTKMTQDFSITWKGEKGTAKGKLKYLDAEAVKQFTALSAAGCYLPIAMTDWYGDDIPKKAGINNISEKTAQDIVFTVSSTEKPVMVTYLGKTVMEIDLSGLTLESASTPIGTKVKTKAKPKPAAAK